MRFRGTTILLVVFALLGGYVYFAEFRGREGREQQKAAEKKAVRFEPKDVAELRLTYENTTIVGVRTSESQWEVRDPQGIEPDNDAWNSLVTSISDIQQDDAIASSDLVQFGLDNPVLEIGLKLSDGQSTLIQFGSENPRKTQSYLKVSENNEVLLTSSKASSFRKSLTDLRDKKVLEVEPDNIDSITFEKVTLQKTEENWVLKTPIQAGADSSEVSTLLGSIQFARAAGFAESSVDLRQAGLDPPSLQLVLHDANAKTNRVLLLGKELETGKFYAKDGSRPTIFIVDNQIGDKLRRPIFDWRDKSLVHFDREKLQEIEIIRSADRLSARKSEENWLFADGRKLQWDKVSSMLNTLEFDKAKDIVDSPRAPSAYGLDKPRLEIVLKSGGPSDLRIIFGANSKVPEGIYLKQSGNQAVVVASTDVYDRFNVKAEDLVEAKPAGAE